MKSIIICSALTAAVALGGCATTQPVAELEQARARVEQVNSNPLAREAAGARLQKMQEALKDAELANSKHEGVEVVRQKAYLASRDAEIVTEQVNEYKARQEVEQGEAARNKALLEARTRDANRALTAAEQATAEAKAQQQQAMASQADADQARAQADAARAAADAARNQTLDAQAESERLKQEMADLQMKQTARGMVLTLGDVLFDTGRSDLKPGAQDNIARLAGFMREHEGFKVVIEGHTDSMGNDDYNMVLSQRRADAVAAALTRAGVTSDRVTTRGMGETTPVASNDNSAGRQQNRRVEIVFSDDKGTFVASTR